MEIKNKSLHSKICNHFTTLKDSSYDDSNSQYMTEHQFEVWKIDDYNSDFQKEIGSSCCLCGVDACFEKDDLLYLVEFKNGCLSYKEIYKILEKMYDSALVIQSKLDLSIDVLQKKVKFVLVYNYQKNRSKELCTFDDGTIEKTRMRNRLREKGFVQVKDRDLIAFGLKKLEMYLFNEVNAIPDSWFDEYLKQENIIS